MGLSSVFIEFSLGTEWQPIIPDIYDEPPLPEQVQVAPPPPKYPPPPPGQLSTLLFLVL